MPKSLKKLITKCLLFNLLETNFLNEKYLKISFNNYELLKID